MADRKTPFPHAPFSYGLPATTGHVLFVDSGRDNASNGNLGDSPIRPLATIEGAFNHTDLTANNGDMIVAMPGHSETVSVAGGLTMDVAGVKVIGLGDGSDTPVVKLTTVTTADVNVDAANITIENIHFVSGFDDIAVCLDVNAADFTVRNCRFTENADNKNFKICIQDASGATSDRMTIEHCYALQDDAANTHFVNLGGTGKGHIIRNNVLLGDWGTMCIGGVGIVIFCTVMDNVIYNAASDTDACINMGSTATGICVRNMAGSAAAQTAGITTGDLVAAQNYHGVSTEDLSAVLEPPTT